MNRRARAAATILVLAGVGAIMLSPIVDPDVWWLLRSGQYMVETRSFPMTDPFSATAQGAPWVNHAWGFELVLYGVYALGGTTGLILLQAMFAVATFGLVYRLLRREGLGQAWALLLVVLGAAATRGFWYPRPQLVTYLGLAVFWAILRDHQAGRGDRLGWLPVLTVLWVNFHGGFLIGPTLVALCLVAVGLDRLSGGEDDVADGPRLRRLGLVLAGTVAASFMSPFHYRAVAFPLQVVGDTFAQSYISEWSALPFQHPQVLLLEALVGWLLVLMLVSPRPFGWRELVPLVAFVHLGFQAIRNTPLLVIVLLPILGRALADCREAGKASESPPPPRESLRWPVTAVTVVAAVLVALIASRSLTERGLADLEPRFGVGDVFPAGAVEFLQRHPRPGTLFNEYVWGGYLVWRLYPAYRVSIDGRAAVYGSRRFAEHVAVVDLHPQWRETLERLGAEVALIRAGSPLAVVLRASPAWEVAYEDQLATVFQRAGARS